MVARRGRRTEGDLQIVRFLSLTYASRLQADGRLEVTGGAWVMTDEATPIFWSSIDNLVEGHKFLRETLGSVPNTSW